MAKAQFFRITDFSGGYNPIQHPSLLKDSEAVEVLNLSLSKPGSLISREGYTWLVDDDTFPPPTGNLIQLGNHQCSSGNSILAHWGDKLYSVSAATGYTDFSSSGWGTTKGRFVNAQGYTLYANGARMPIAFDGTDVLPLGVPAPLSAPTATAANAGAGAFDAATWEIVYTRVQDGTLAESNPSPVGTVTLSSSSDIALSWSPHSQSGFSKIRVYIKKSTDAVFLQIGEIDNDGSHTFTSAAFLNIALEENNNEALDFDHVEFFNGYYFGTRDNVLYWSKAWNPFAWPGMHFAELPFVGNDTVTALVSHQDTLLIFGRRNLILVSGYGPFGFSLVRVDADYGAVGVDAVIELGTEVLFVAHDGLRSFPGFGLVSPITSQLIAEAPRDIRRTSVLSYLPDKRELWVSFGGRTYVVYLPTQSVTVYDFEITTSLTGGNCGQSPLLFSNGGALKQYGGVSDAGEPIRVEWKSKVFPMGTPEFWKYLRRMELFVSPRTVLGGVVHMPDTGRQYPFTLSSALVDTVSLWDVAQWDEAQWVAEGIQGRLIPLPAQSLYGTSMQLLLTSDVLGRMEITPPITFLYREANRFLSWG